MEGEGAVMPDRLAVAILRSKGARGGPARRRRRRSAPAGRPSPDYLAPTPLQVPYTADCTATKPSALPRPDIDEARVVWEWGRRYAFRVPVVRVGGPWSQIRDALRAR